MRIPAIAATHSAVKAATHSGHCCHPIGDGMNTSLSDAREAGAT